MIDVLRHELDRNLVVLAPTGVAALNVGGQTIHSFFQLPPGPQPIGRKLQGVSREVVAKMDILIIDEVSMATSEQIDAISQACQNVEPRPHLQNIPFAGKRIILGCD